VDFDGHAFLGDGEIHKMPRGGDPGAERLGCAQELAGVRSGVWSASWLVFTVVGGYLVKYPTGCPRRL
jgi:hypothetical protein